MLPLPIQQISSKKNPIAKEKYQKNVVLAYDNPTTKIALIDIKKACVTYVTVLNKCNP